MAAACEERNLLVKVPGAAAETGTVTLSPFDIANIGRATPMTWFYEETLDADALLQSLAETLTSYQVLSGRYAGTPMPTAINLVNAGVPVRICSAPGSTTMADAVAHLPGSSSAGPAYFTMHTHEAYVSEKASMDPDPCSADAPLLKIQITYFAGGGTAIGQLGMHGVVDAFSQIALFINWSRAFRNLPIALPPTHERSAVDKLAVSSPPPPSPRISSSRGRWRLARRPCQSSHQCSRGSGATLWRASPSLRSAWAPSSRLRGQAARRACASLWTTC